LTSRDKEKTTATTSNSLALTRKQHELTQEGFGGNVVKSRVYDQVIIAIMGFASEIPSIATRGHQILGIIGTRSFSDTMTNALM
jgi:hypothetical protein